MLKKIAVMTVVLAVCSVASADDPIAGSIFQTQSFGVGNANDNGMAIVINLVHGNSDAQSYQDLYIKNEQETPEQNQYSCYGGLFGVDLLGGCGGCGGDNCSVTANQEQKVDLEQDAEAEGSCGIITINTFMDAVGAQEQMISNATAAKYQLQELGFAADQVLARSSGQGEGEATNEAYLKQEQSGENAAGSMYEYSKICADQDSFMDGEPNSTVTMLSTLLATTVQGQQVY